MQPVNLLPAVPKVGIRRHSPKTQPHDCFFLHCPADGSPSVIAPPGDTPIRPLEHACRCSCPQTDHVEFNLQSAVVETLEEAQEREGVEGASVSSHSRRKHAFRLVSTPASEEKPSPASPAAVSTTSFGEARSSRSSTTPCEAALARDAAEAEERNSRGSWSQASACNGGGKPSRQVWVLAATSEKVSEAERALVVPHPRGRGLHPQKKTDGIGSSDQTQPSFFAAKGAREVEGDKHTHTEHKIPRVSPKQKIRTPKRYVIRRSPKSP